MIAKPLASKDDLEALWRKVKRAISGSAVATTSPPAIGVSNFTDLADVPDSYSGLAGCAVAVNAAENGVDFNLYVTLAENAPILTIRNYTDLEVDPVLRWSLGATPVVAFSAGVDDSDGNSWKLSAGSALGTNDRIVVTTTPRIGLFTASPQAPIHYVTPSPGNIPDIILEETLADKALQLRLKNPTRSWDIIADSLPDRFGIANVDSGAVPFFVAGATSNIAIWSDIWTETPDGGYSFGTGAPLKIISLLGYSTFPTAQGADRICLGNFNVAGGGALGVMSGGEVKSYFGNSWFLNDSANADMNRGATLNCGIYEDQILAFKFSFNNGFPDLVEIDTFADFRVNTANGGVEINGYSAGAVARGDYSFYTSGNTTLGTGGYASHTLYSAKAFVGDYGNCGATDNIFALRPYYGGGWLSCWICNATGNSWQSGKAQANQLQADVAIGTAPLIVTSTTLVSNLNAQYLGGNLAAAFALAGHTHPGVYEPALGNPAHDGYVLSSTAAGVRSWIAPGGGASTFLSLTDVDELDYTGHEAEFVVVNLTADGLVFSPSSVAGHTILSVNHTDVDPTPPEDGDVLTWFASPGVWGAAPNFGGGAPTDAEYLVLALNAGLTGERLFTAGEGLALADAGAGGAATLSATSVHKHLVETFDSLTTGNINGQGSYFQCGAWWVAPTGVNSTAEVVVKGGSDKMMRLFAAHEASATGVTAGVTLVSTIGLSGGFRIRYKMKIDQDVTGFSGGVLVANAAGSTVASVRFGYATGLKIRFYDGSTNTVLQAAAKDTWYQIDIVYVPYATTSGIARIFIDGVYSTSIATGASNTKWDSIRGYCTNAAAAGDLNIDVDDLCVYSLMPLFTEI